jgi:hypothetical protein
LDHVEKTPTRFNFKRDVITYFWVPAQKGENTEKIKKIYLEEIKKIIAVKRGCQSAQKIAKNWLRRFKNTKIEI